MAVPGRPGGRVQATVDVRVLDLSATGARIEHSNLLRPGFTCALELPQSLGGRSLPVRVVRSSVIGAEGAPTGDRVLRYESGLAFGVLSLEQRAALEAVLARLAPGGKLGEGRLVL
jgi:hypothetical protein